MAERDREDGRPGSVHKSHKAGRMSHAFSGTGDRKRVAFDRKYELSPGALYELLQAITFGRDHSTT